LLAEIEDGDGWLIHVSLLAYLGADRWRAVGGSGKEMIVEADQIRSLTVDRPPTG
jgi:hypothetical protein